MGLARLRPQANRRYLWLAAILVLAVYVLVPQVGDFRTSWHLLSHPLPGWTALAASLTLLTYLAAAMTYRLLALKPIRYAPTLLVQLAAMFINRLLPGGIGALGANYAYLRHRRHNAAQAASLVAINNLLGAAGHGALLVVLAAFSTAHLVPEHEHLTGNLLRIIVIVVLAIVGAAVFLGWPRLKRQLRDLVKQLQTYRRQIWRLPSALLSSMTLTMANILALQACGLALGIHLPLAVIFIVFTFGVSAGTATPTPGGLGGFEAGLAAGFIAYHVASPTALAAALLYRLVSYWLPLAIGAVAFIVAERRGLFQMSS